MYYIDFSTISPNYTYRNLYVIINQFNFLFFLKTVFNIFVANFPEKYDYVTNKIIKPYL